MANNEFKVIFIFKIITRFVRKCFSFMGKHPNVYPKDVC